MSPTVVVASVEVVGDGRRRSQHGGGVRVVDVAGVDGVPRAQELGRVLGEVRWTGSRRLVEVVGLGGDGESS